MIASRLSKIDPDDLEDVLFKIEDSLSIRFDTNELSEIKIFGELIKVITNKIDLIHNDDCTSQQAFYKIRKSISLVLNIPSQQVSPSSKLNELFPKEHRIKNIHSVQKNLGFKLNILRPHHFITSSLALFLLVSLIYLAFDWRIALVGICISIISINLSNKAGKIFEVNTVGELVKRMTRDNYVNSRRNKESFNSNEVENLIITIFSEHLGIHKSELTLDAQLFTN